MCKTWSLFGLMKCCMASHKPSQLDLNLYDVYVDKKQVRFLSHRNKGYHKRSAQYRLTGCDFIKRRRESYSSPTYLAEHWHSEHTTPK
jgi:hypothetical protein